MSEPVLTVYFYKTPMGSEPVREWLKSLSKHDRDEIGCDIKTVQYGWPIGMPLVEKLEAKLWEVRTNNLSFGIARILFTIINNQMILLHGLPKKSQKLALEDLDLARKCLLQVMS